MSPVPTFTPTRRRALRQAAAAVAAPALLLAGRARAQALPAMTEGPFYPLQLPADSDADLTQVQGHARRAQGEPLDWQGRLLDKRGQPLAGVRVEIWQCDALGAYHLHGPAPARYDPDFQGFGAQLTASDGGFAFRTIKPVPYPGRAPHIHVKLRAAAFGEWTTQLFVSREPGNERDFLYRGLTREQRDAVSMDVQHDGTGWHTRHVLRLGAV